MGMKSFGVGISVKNNNEAELKEAFDLLSDGGIVKDPFGTVEPWSPCCAFVIDKYGISW